MFGVDVALLTSVAASVVIPSLLGLTIVARAVGSGHPHRNAVWREYRGIGFHLSADRFIYDPGDTVHVRFGISNETATRVILRTSAQPKVEFAVFPSSRESILWSSLESGFQQPIVEYTQLLPDQDRWSTEMSLPLASVRGLPDGPREAAVQLVMGGLVGRWQQSEVGPRTLVAFSERSDPFYLEEYFRANTGAREGDTVFDPALDFDGDGVLTDLDRLTWADSQPDSLWSTLPPDSTVLILSIVVREPSADFNQDHIVDFRDLELFRDRYRTAWGGPQYHRDFDLDGDGVVGLTDFFLFADRFGGVR